MKRRCSLRATVLRFVLLALSIVTAAASSLSQQDHTCPLNCSCEVSQIACEGRVPHVVSDTIEEVTVTYSPKQIEKIFYPGVFCNVTWKNVHTLTLTLHIRNIHAVLIAVHDLFLCLYKIQTLKLGNFIPSSSLSGLSNVIYFCISQTTDSERYLFYYYPRLTFLSDMNKVPKLTHFRYSWLRMHTQRDVLINDQFIRDLSTRPIQMLDFSSTRILFNFTNSSRLCQTLTRLKLRDSKITIQKLPWTCPSLLFVDLSGVNYFQDLFKSKCYIFVHFPMHSIVLLSAKILYMDRMVTSPLGDISTTCKVRLPATLLEFHFTHNVLPTFKFRFRANSLRYIKLSNNYMEILNTLVFAELPSLQKIDLSFNNLHLIGSLDNTVPNLFEQNLYLRIIDFSSNKLSSLPFASSNNLEEILISNNSFTQITFNISNLYNLTLLDLRFNDIHNFDSSSRQALEALYELQQQRIRYSTNNKSLQILLEGNPFTCRCSDLDFLWWVVKFPMFDSRRQKYVCYLNDQQYTLNNEAVEAASYECKRAERERRTILLSTIIPGITVIIVSITVWTLYRRRKRRLLRERREDQLRLVQETNTLFNFPVFLSYSSLDKEFVANHVHQPLQVQPSFNGSTIF